MMLPVTRFKGQPAGMVTTTTPWLSVSTDPSPQWLWLASWSAATYQAMPPLVFYPPAVWIPEHAQLMQWERPAVEVVPLVQPFYQSSPLHHHCHHRFPKLQITDTWFSPEEVGVFPRRQKRLLLTNRIIPRSRRQTSAANLLLFPPQLSDHIRRDNTKTRDVEPEDSSSSSLPLHLLSLSPLPLPTALPPADVMYCEWTGLHKQRHKEAWHLILPNQHRRVTWLRPMISCESRPTPPMQQCVSGPVRPSQLCTEKCPVLPLQVIKEVQPFFSSQFSSRFTLLTNYRHRKRGTGGGKLSYQGALLLRTKKPEDRQCVSVSVHKEEDDDEEEEDIREGRRKDKRPVASTPVPGSPWCVVWTGDDRVFFFNPTIHLSVWERPGELIDRDISRIIEDPPHKRKKTSPSEISSSCQSTGLHRNDEDEDNDLKHSTKRNRTEESMSLVPHPGRVQLLPLELRIAHFKEMMLERGVSAFSTWEKELHKMVFDPRYLLLTSDQRKQVFDQFVKSRMKDEYKEKKSKLQKAREEFKQLLEEAKITSRTTFKEFCVRYRDDQRFSTLTRKKEQEVLFSHYITALKKREKENRTRLRKMR
ncbi:uncharacterized protein LOC120722896 isoform X1 [Simochromis diagramma]|uniref:uncharacterized protein LOC120722896 isoform X1 n=1 Tax=Simochromis diagramma TaxID=43689 RepID=UPI001A7E64AD|nr:uncharacterized protein LOC120722896 isoform X1 [Simochromis diagramma]XP_039870010.1 uncharacterized protein LOC120722896 isoform X1 [Simochromis diagramma]